jgi:hypothetical protein
LAVLIEYAGFKLLDPDPDQVARDIVALLGRRMSGIRCISDSTRTFRDFRVVPILLQKTLVFSVDSDLVALRRFAVEADDDGRLSQEQGQFFYLFRLDEAVPVSSNPRDCRGP